MRIWSIHPSCLDGKGLVALWRETLPAQKVLTGQTKGYRNHPQLERFKACADPTGAIAAYLTAVADEADRRGYRFDRNKIGQGRFDGKLSVTAGQVIHELKHLLGKLKVRDPERYDRLKDISEVMLHPLFVRIEGDIESWEKV